MGKGWSCRHTGPRLVGEAAPVGGGVTGPASGLRLSRVSAVSARGSRRRLQNDVRSPDGDIAGPSQETLQGGVGQEILEGESDYFFSKVMEGCVCPRRRHLQKMCRLLENIKWFTIGELCERVPIWPETLGTFGDACIYIYISH